MVELRDAKRERRRFLLRLALAAGCVPLLFGVLFARFFYLQIIKHDIYTTLAENNRISVVPVPPTRGMIYDRNGVVLANNYSAYTLEITPSKVHGPLSHLLDQLSKIVEITPKDRRRFKRLMEDSRNFESLPIRVQLSDAEVARFAANAYRFPGVALNARLFRNYPLGKLMADVVGYIGRINDRDLQRLDKTGQTANYRGTEYIGKTGVEAEYEKQLHGTTGVEEVEVDALGREVRVISRTPAISGSNLVLSLDSRLQEVAWNAFGDYSGALVAIDPRSGAVLAMVSKPSYDPNLFVEGIDPQTWNALNTSPDHPLTNRAIRGQYPPGSTFKPFMAFAGLELGVRTPEQTIDDPGYYQLPGHTHRYRDWKRGGHGIVNMHKAIVHSCDTYFYSLAHDLGIDNIHNFISQFGFGKPTGIDLPGEADGVLPSRAWKRKRFGQQWYEGDTVSVGIGQGYDLVTPLQLANATAIIADNGTVYRPHVVSYIEDSRSHKNVGISTEPVRHIQIKPGYWAVVQQAMVDVTHPGGTAARVAKGAPYVFAAKTGTAQVVALRPDGHRGKHPIEMRHRDHALFIAYAPADNPTIALSVLVEHGGEGASAAAPIARKVLDYYLLGKKPTPLEATAANRNEPGD